jgi:hypothetical protein
VLHKTASVPPRLGCSEGKGPLSSGRCCSLLHVALSPSRGDGGVGAGGRPFQFSWALLSETRCQGQASTVQNATEPFQLPGYCTLIRAMGLIRLAVVNPTKERHDSAMGILWCPFTPRNPLAGLIRGCSSTSDTEIQYVAVSGRTEIISNGQRFSLTAYVPHKHDGIPAVRSQAAHAGEHGVAS